MTAVTGFELLDEIDIDNLISELAVVEAEIKDCQSEIEGKTMWAKEVKRRLFLVNGKMETFLRGEG